MKIYPIKVLFVATEFAPGMIPFASSIINILSHAMKSMQ